MISNYFLSSPYLSELPQPKITTLNKSRKQSAGNEAESRRDGNELDCLIHELIVSEIDYVNDLRLCRSAYIQPLSTSFNLSDIFINWHKLIVAHETSIDFLSASLMDNKKHHQILELFLKLLSSIVNLYIEFCSQINESRRKFDSKIAIDVRFRQLVNECQRKLARIDDQQVDSMETSSISSRAIRNLNLPLTSFLLKPMQRITKYSLIFERISKVAKRNQANGLIGIVERLEVEAQSLCNRVNEACRLKEENENNKRKLSWAQSHIKQTDASNEFRNLTLSSEKSPFDLSEHQEVIQFDSETKFLGNRKLIKAGSLIKKVSGKELVLFLFNDLLLITQPKGASQLRVEDVFASSRAQQSYYKLYRRPIFVEDLKVCTSSSFIQASSRSSCSEHQLISVSFTDLATNYDYNLLALNAQEKSIWIRLLEEKSKEAKEAKSSRDWSSDWTRKASTTTTTSTPTTPTLNLDLLLS